MTPKMQSTKSKASEVKPKTEAAGEKKTTKPAREKSGSGAEAVVFAFRLTPVERDLLHRAAGPAKASRFVLGAALAAANADTKAFNTLVEQAKTNLK
jgi:hypothetical protein